VIILLGRIKRSVGGKRPTSRITKKVDFKTKKLHVKIAK